jgi:hypothetical protein
MSVFVVAASISPKWFLDKFKSAGELTCIEEMKELEEFAVNLWP